MKKLIALTALIALGSIITSAQEKHKSTEKAYDSIITNTVIIKTKDGKHNTKMPTHFLPTTFIECSIDGIMVRAESARHYGRELFVYTNATFYIGDSTVIRTTGESTKSRMTSNSIHGNKVQYYMQGLDSSQQEELATGKGDKDGSKQNRVNGICIIAEKVEGNGVDSLVLTNATYYVGEKTVFETSGRSVMMHHQSNSLGYKAAKEFMENGSLVDTQARELLENEVLEANAAELRAQRESDNQLAAEAQRLMRKRGEIAKKGTTLILGPEPKIVRNGLDTITRENMSQQKAMMVSMQTELMRDKRMIEHLEKVMKEMKYMDSIKRSADLVINGYAIWVDQQTGILQSKQIDPDPAFRLQLGAALHYNGLVENLSKMTLPDDAKYMNLNAKSIGVDLSFFEAKIMKCGPVSLRTGLQMEINNFRFEENIGLKKDQAGNIVADNSYTERGIDIQKSKLTTVYLNVPLQVRFNVGYSKMWLSAGGVMGLLIQSHTKVKTNELGKEKSRNDSNVRNFHYGLQAAVGYSEYALTVRYYPHSIFRSGQGPAVQQINVSLGCRL